MSNRLLYFSANVMWVIEPRSMRWEGNVACAKKRLLLDYRGNPEEK
jgi:hypothetical protein